MNTDDDTSRSDDIDRFLVEGCHEVLAYAKTHLPGQETLIDLLEKCAAEVRRSFPHIEVDEASAGDPEAPPVRLT